MTEKTKQDKSECPLVVTTQSKSSTSKLRLLDFDDMLLLQYLLEGNTVAATAKKMSLTQPAITQRVRKIERVFGEAVLQKVGRYVRLTKRGQAISKKASDALALMRGVSSGCTSLCANLGVDPDSAPLVWDALAELREIHPEYTFNTMIASSEEITTRMEDGSIDVCLSNSSSLSCNCASIKVSEQNYILVAPSAAADAVKAIDDLKGHVLLELDKSYPTLQLVEAKSRAKMGFKDVWFLGSYNLLISALIKGHGMAIVPENMVLNAMSAGLVKQVLPDLNIQPTTLQLLHSQDRNLQGMFKHLSSVLISKA